MSDSLAGAPERPRFSQALLLCLTVFACLLTGSYFLPHFAESGILEHIFEVSRRPSLLLGGIPYALTLLLVIGIHEAGHILAARKWGVRATWPFFLPGPPYISLGTFGAFIKIKTVVPNRPALLEIGASGPIAGCAASLCAAAAGYALHGMGFRSPADFFGVNLRLPLGFWALRGLFTGNWQGEALFFENPVLAASWIGLFFQGLNLLPVGQLDGGHVLYALAGRGHAWVSRGIALFFFILAFWEPQWLVWVCLLVLLGLRHPPCLDESVPLGPSQRFQGLLALLVFAISFHPFPFVM